MSRFINLEFNQQSEDRSPAQVKDERTMALKRRPRSSKPIRNGSASYAKVLEFNPQNTAAWTGQVRALNELGNYDEARRWAEKALERFPHEPELLAAKAVALGRSGDFQGALAFSDAAIEERRDTPTSGWPRRCDARPG